MSMSLGVVAALLTMQHLRVDRLIEISLLTVDVPTVAALRTEVEAMPTIGARIPGGAETVTLRRPAARRAARQPWLRWRTCAGSSTLSPSARLRRRGVPLGSGLRLPHWIPHRGAVRVSRHCRHLLMDLALTSPAVARAPSDAHRSATCVTNLMAEHFLASRSVTFVIILMVERFLERLRRPGSRAQRQAGLRLAGQSLSLVLSLAMLMTPRRDGSRMSSRSASVLRLAMAGFTP